MQDERVDRSDLLINETKKNISTLDGPKTSNFQSGRLIAFKKKYMF